MRRARSGSSLSVFITAAGSLLLAASTQAQAWTQIGPALTPAPRDGAVMVYDPVHKHMVLFGGDTDDYTNETWILDEDVWTRRSPEHAPEPRSNAYSFWDSARNRMVVFGGNAAGQIDRSRIWTWDGSDWSSFMPATNPPGRRDAAVAYDTTRDRIVLFGGVVDGSPDVTLADTWEFDGTAWTQIATSTSPVDRGAALMGYDPVRKLMVLVRGYSESRREGQYDTWTYDGSNWKEVPSSRTPTGTSLEIMWDPSQQKLLIAGRKETGSLGSWTFDGTSWSEQASTTYNINGLFEPGLAFDLERGYALYLRQENSSYLGFRLRAAAWDQLLPVPQPGGGYVNRGALIFDSAAGEPRLFVEPGAGQGLQGWRWDGIMWRHLKLAGAQVPNTSGRIAHDAERGVTLAFDGRTFELEGTSWKVKTSTSAPSAAGAMAHDAGRGRLLYFGGTVAFAKYADTTFTWDGTRWEELGVAGTPPPRSGAALAYDARRGRMVLFGGMGTLNGQQRYLFDTWELNGNSWTESSVQGPQDLRDWPSMTYDQTRRRIVLWGKQNEEDARVWEYDGRAWIGTEPPPIAGESGLLGYDAAGARLLLHDEHGNTWARPSAGGSTDPEGEVTAGDGEPSTGGDAGGTQGSADAGADDEGTGDDASDSRGGDSGCATAAGSQARGSWALVALVAVLLRRRRQRSAL